MTTSRPLANAIENALDFMVQAELLLLPGTLARHESWIGWHAANEAPFLVSYVDITTEDYLRWLEARHYTAVLRDGSLLQLTYRFTRGDLVAHRLAYVPCPVPVDESWLAEGDAVADVVNAHLEYSSAYEVPLRSPVRFDFARDEATPRHPAVHLTINGADCRIACVAPLHPYRFIDFVFRHFYPELRKAQHEWFDAAAATHIGARVIAESDLATPHIAWSLS